MHQTNSLANQNPAVSSSFRSETMADYLALYQLVATRYCEENSCTKEEKEDMCLTLAEILMGMAGLLAHEVNESLPSAEVKTSLCLAFSSMIFDPDKRAGYMP